jgi:hypothetical protein
MTWSDFYLICFAVGFGFSFMSFVFGGSRFGRFHMPHHLPHFGHGMGHVPVAHGPVGGASSSSSAGNVPAATHGTGTSQNMHGMGVSPFNPPTIAAFLAWFGGTGYLLSRYSTLRVGTELVLSTTSGLAGGAIIFLFLSRVLISEEESMDPADYEMVGVLGKLANPIREGGTGELVYSQAGTRRVCGARSEGGEAIAKGIEVVVTRYDKGIAYVRLWSEMSGEQE